MSSTPQRSSNGAAAAAMISGSRLTLFLEGKKFDVPYYESLIESRPEFRRFGVRYTRVSDVQEDGSATGGKGRALKLHQDYARSGKLVQVTKSGSNVIAFCLDRDFDLYANRLVDEPEIVYTHTSDVEGELHEFGDVATALRSALHLSRDEANTLVEKLGDYRQDLALRWQHWITLCIAAEALRSRGRVQPSQMSAINKDRFGAVDMQQYEYFQLDVITRAGIPDAESGFVTAAALVQKLIETKQWGRLLKGKWLASFVVYRIGEIYPLSRNDEKELLKTLNVSLVPTLKRGHALDFFDRILNLLEPSAGNGDNVDVNMGSPV